MVKWDILTRIGTAEPKKVKTLFEEAGFDYQDAETYCMAIIDMASDLSDIWIFCYRVEGNKLLCKDHYFSGR